MEEEEEEEGLIKIYTRHDSENRSDIGLFFMCARHAIR